MGPHKPEEKQDFPPTQFCVLPLWFSEDVEQMVFEQFYKAYRGSSLLTREVVLAQLRFPSTIQSKIMSNLKIPD